MQQRVKLFWLNHAYSFLWCDHAFVYQIAGNLDCSVSGTFTISGLQHEEFAVFDGELHILHVAVMLLQTMSNIAELIVYVRHDVFEFIDVLWSTNTSNNVFALCVDKELTEQTVFTGCRVTGKCYAGTGSVAGVAEYHGLYVNSSAPGGWDIIHSSVVDCTWVIPGTEYCFYSFHQLFSWLLWEIFIFLFFIVCFKADNHFFQVICVELGVKSNAFCFFHLVDDNLKLMFWNFHNNVGEHLDEAAIGVVSKTLIVGQFSKTFYNLIV